MLSRMKLHFPILAGSLALLGLVGCVSPTAVDFDRAAVETIRDYKCFTIDAREIRENYQDVVLSPIVDRRIVAALSAELKAKGYTDECANPDFRVTFNTVTQTRTEIEDYGAGAFRRYHYYSLGAFNRIEIDQYEEGTFVVDIIDASSNELVWRGAYRQRLGWSAPSDEEVRRIVSEILAGFPPGSTGE